MYLKFYGFKEKPFQIVPNPAFLYKSIQHRNALTYLEYGLSENTGFILLTGEIGSGKTTLIQHLLQCLNTDFEVAVVFNTNVNAEQMLQMILNEFELPVLAGKAAALNQLYQFLVEKYAAKKRVLLIIDEAQNLCREALEEVRMLSNLHTGDQALLQIMLAGQPDLIARLRDPALRQFSQRVAVSYHLAELNREETGSYIAFRIQKAGGRPDIFSTEAVDMIHQISGGIPRAMNHVCQAALVYGFADEEPIIGRDIIQQIIDDNISFSIAAQSAAEPKPAGNAASNPAGKTSAAIQIRRLEKSVAHLETRLEYQIKALEKHAGSARQELHRLVHVVLQQERRRSDELLLKYNRLEKKFNDLRRKQGLIVLPGKKPL